MTTCICEHNMRLRRQRGKYVLHCDGTRAETPVKVKFVRPLTGRDSEIVFIDEKKKEVAMVDGLDMLDPVSREVATEALDQGYLITQITRVDRTHTYLGTRFWEVKTDRGPRTFAMRDPSRSVTVMEDGRMVLWDTLGNCYEIDSFEGLDEHSQRQVRKII